MYETLPIFYDPLVIFLLNILMFRLPALYRQDPLMRCIKQQVSIQYIYYDRTDYVRIVSILKPFFFISANQQLRHHLVNVCRHSFQLSHAELQLLFSHQPTLQSKSTMIVSCIGIYFIIHNHTWSIMISSIGSHEAASKIRPFRYHINIYDVSVSTFHLTRHKHIDLCNLFSRDHSHMTFAWHYSLCSLCYYIVYDIQAIFVVIDDHLLMIIHET